MQNEAEIMRHYSNTNGQSSRQHRSVKYKKFRFLQFVTLKIDIFALIIDIFAFSLDK